MDQEIPKNPLGSISRFQRLLINNMTCPGPLAQAIALRALGALLEAADLATEMAEVSTSLVEGSGRKKGIEF